MNEFGEVFNIQGAMKAIVGGIGGLVRSLFLRTGLADTIRAIIFGAGCAFGFGDVFLVFFQQHLGVSEVTPGLVIASWFAAGAFGTTVFEVVFRTFQPKKSKGANDGQA